MELKIKATFEQKLYLAIMVLGQYAGAIMGAYILTGLLITKDMYLSGNILEMIIEISVIVNGVSCLYVIARRHLMGIKRLRAAKKASKREFKNIVLS